jgi:putative sigma-54 modulation protein
MELEFTFRNVEPTDAIKAWAQKRFQKVTKHLKDPSSAHIVVSVDKYRHRAELTVHSHGDILRATDESDDMYTTLDQVMVKLEAAAQRQKERLTPR